MCRQAGHQSWGRCFGARPCRRLRCCRGSGQRCRGWWSAGRRPRSQNYRWSPQMATMPNPCIGVCVSVSRVPTATMEGWRLPANLRGGGGCGAVLRSSCCMEARFGTSSRKKTRVKVAAGSTARQCRPHRTKLGARRVPVTEACEKGKTDGRDIVTGRAPVIHRQRHGRRFGHAWLLAPNLHDGTIRGSDWLHEGAGAEQVLGRRQLVNPALVCRGHGSG